jgi:predicted RNA-binding Zn-ribbon protein involved in translation (DUF1610 family)
MTDVTPPRIALPLLDRDEGFSLAHRWLRPPGIRLENEAICYDDPDNKAVWVKNPGLKLVADFATLAAAPPEAILQFARRWGVLGLCQHRAGGSPPLVAAGVLHSRLSAEVCRLSYAESLESWRYYADFIGLLVNRAAALQKRHALSLRSTNAKNEVQSFVRQCDWVARYFGCLRPILVVEDGRFEVKLGSHIATGLPAALASQLLFTLAGSAPLVTCASCGKLFPPRRRPPAGQRAYCPNCGIRAAWREAQSRRRERAKQYQKKKSRSRTEKE